MQIVHMERHGVPFYACPDWDGAAHGFSTRLGGVSPSPWESLDLGANRGDRPENVDENFRRFCAAIGSDPQGVVKNKQIHSDLVRPVTRADAVELSAPGAFQADGLITDEPGVCLTVFSGDCIPILFYDPSARCVAAVHAGWRGTAAGIAARAVEAMIRDYGCCAENIRAAIGPGIGPCCFETHSDVPDALLESLGSHAHDFIRPAVGAEGKFHVDLKGANGRWLELSGLSREHIAVCSACTACRLDEFWSHRIQGQSRGSMAAMIQLT